MNYSNIADMATRSCIEANPDVGGIGVRIAFYAQSFVNPLLVAFSPVDAVPTAWSGTLLTTALVIAGMVGKFSGTSQLSLHHAVMIMNFSTLTCISSLAAAPMLPIWRLSATQYYNSERARRALLQRSDLPQNIIESEFSVNLNKKEIKSEQTKARVILSLALLLQISLQWAWGVALFVSPKYSDQDCNAETRLVLFLRTFVTKDINTISDPNYWVWPFWLLTSLGITLGLAINLALSSPSRAHDTGSRHTPMDTASGQSPATPVLYALAHIAREAIPSWRDREKLLIFIGNLIAIGLWCIFVAATEKQQNANTIEGESAPTSFGQITALLLAFAPMWNLTVAFYKYPTIRRRQNRRRQREEEEARALEENERLLPSPGHSRNPSDTTIDLYEMTHLSRSASGSGSDVSMGYQEATLQVPETMNGFLTALTPAVSRSRTTKRMIDTEIPNPNLGYHIP